MSGAWKRKGWRWSNLLPWNWFRCCRPEYEPAQSEPVHPEYRKLTSAEAAAKLGLSDPEDRKVAITEPVADIFSELPVHNSVWKPTDTKQFRLYLLHNDELVQKRQKELVAFSGFGTNKDFVSFIFGQQQQGDYVLYGGDRAFWYQLSPSGSFRSTRIFRAIHRETKDIYIILTNSPVAKNADFVTPIRRNAEMISRLVERSDLSKPPSSGFNPIPANSGFQ